MTSQIEVVVTANLRPPAPDQIAARPFDSACGRLILGWRPASPCGAEPLRSNFSRTGVMVSVAAHTPPAPPWPEAPLARGTSTPTSPMLAAASESSTVGTTATPPAHLPRIIASIPASRASISPVLADSPVSTVHQPTNHTFNACPVTRLSDVFPNGTLACRHRSRGRFEGSCTPRPSVPGGLALIEDVPRPRSPPANRNPAPIPRWHLHQRSHRSCRLSGRARPDSCTSRRPQNRAPGDGDNFTCRRPLQASASSPAPPRRPRRTVRA